MKLYIGGESVCVALS